MARKNFAIEKGLDLNATNGELQASIIQTNAAPTGTGEQSDAPIGSLLIRTGTAELYQKTTNVGNSSDWTLVGTGGSVLGSFRDERVNLLTDDVLSAGSFDPTTLTDNDAGFSASNLVVGQYIISAAASAPALWEITAISAPNVTIAAAADPIALQDVFSVRLYLPDPLGQEGQAIVVSAGSSMAKVADVDFSNARAITLAAPYTPANGDPVAGSDVQTAIEFLDGNQDDIQTTLGRSQGSTDMGSYTGSTVGAGGTVKQNIQDLETQVDTNVSDISTNAAAIATNSANIATNTSDIATNSSDIATNAGNIATNAANIATNTADIASNTADVADLRTTTGTADGDTDYGTFPGNTLSDNADGKTLYTELEDAAEGSPEVQTGVSSVTVLDFVEVDLYRSAVWLVTAFDEANPTDVKSAIVHAANNGTSSADATGIDDNVSSLLQSGIFNTQINLVLAGTGTNQQMQLQVNTSEAGVTFTAVRLGAAPSGY